MASFEQAHKLTAAYEGFYVNNPADRGGETYRGVARNAHPKWTGWAIVDALKKKPDFPKNLRNHVALNAEVDMFYRSVFWNKIRGDDLLDQRLANYVFDFAVNSGVVTAGRFLQRALNVHARGRFPELVADGQIGGKTLQALDAVGSDIGAVAATLLEERKEFVQDLAVKNPSQQVFLKGWLARLKRLEKDSDSVIV